MSDVCADVRRNGRAVRQRKVNRHRFSATTGGFGNDAAQDIGPAGYRTRMVDQSQEGRHHTAVAVAGIGSTAGGPLSSRGPGRSGVLERRPARRSRRTRPTTPRRDRQPHRRRLGERVEPGSHRRQRPVRRRFLDPRRDRSGDGTAPSPTPSRFPRTSSRPTR